MGLCGQVAKSFRGKVEESMKDRKQLTLRLPDELYGALEKISNETGLSVTSLLFISMWNNVLKPYSLL